MTSTTPTADDLRVAAAVLHHATREGEDDEVAAGVRRTGTYLMELVEYLEMDRAVDDEGFALMRHECTGCSMAWTEGEEVPLGHWSPDDPRAERCEGEPRPVLR